MSRDQPTVAATTMIEAADGQHAILIEPGHPHHGWAFYKGADGQWVTWRVASALEISMAEGVKKQREWAASFVASREVRPDYTATVCGGCDRPKEKCSCSDGDCG